MVGNQKNVGSREPSFAGVITSSVKLSEAVSVQEQVISCPELPELSVFGFDDLLYGGYLYAAPHGSLVEIIPGGVATVSKLMDPRWWNTTPGSLSPLLIDGPYCFRNGVSAAFAN